MRHPHLSTYDCEDTSWREQAKEEVMAQAHRRADDEKKDKEKWESTGAPARAPCSLSRSHHVALFLARCAPAEAGEARDQGAGLI